MKTSLIIKLNFLFLGLGLSLYFMYSLNSKGLSPAVQNMFGVVQTKALSSANEFKLNWCDTRVTALIRPEEFKISQQGNNWVRESKEASVIDFVAFEKWLARSCAIRAEKVSLTEDESFLPALMVKFVDGQVGVIRRHPNGVFSWKGQAFTSPAFDAALNELSSLPEGRRK